MPTDYDAFAQHFDATRQLPWKDAVDFLESLPENSRVLDIGCGNGRHMAEAKKLGLKAFGLDKSKKLAKIARNKTGLPTVIGDILAMPFADGALNYSVCIAVIHHLGTEKKRIDALKEIARLTKKSAIISVWALEQEKFAKRKTQDIELGWDKKFPRFYHLFKCGELENLIEKAGLNVARSFKSGNNYWANIGL